MVKASASLTVISRKLGFKIQASYLMLMMAKTEFPQSTLLTWQRWSRKFTRLNLRNSTFSLLITLKDLFKNA